MSKPVCVRLDEDCTSFLEQVRGDLTVAEAIRGVIQYLRRFDPDYTKGFLVQITPKSQ